MKPHEVLGVDKNASIEEIQKAYGIKAAKHHPSAGGDKWAFHNVLMC